MRKLIFIVAVAIACALAFSSCKKETLFNVTFYSTEYGAGEFVAEGIQELNFYADGDFIGSMPAKRFFKVVPDCGNPEAVNASFMSFGESLDVSFLILDENDNIIYMMDENLIASCTTIEL